MTALSDEPGASSASVPDLIELLIFVRSSDSYGGHPLHAEVVERARAAGLPGATVLRGMQGFGGSGTMHSAGWAGISDGVPVMIQIVGGAAQLTAFLPVLYPLIGSRLVISAPVTARCHPVQTFQNYQV